MFRRIYLDNSATTPVDAAVLEAMLPHFKEDFGNASSIHYFGQRAKAAIDRGRHQVAELINARPNEIVFTSGGTESNNLAVRGLAEANRHRGGHIVTSAIEHPAVRSVCEDLEKRGFVVTFVPVSPDGLVSEDDVKAAIRETTLLVSIMAANNEIGTLQPVPEIGRHIRGLREQGQKIWFHTDAVQAVGKSAVDVEEMSVDMLSLSAHKINGPKGVGALYVRRGVKLRPQNIGGRQERGVRGGTESVPLIAGLGEACSLAGERLGSIDGDVRRLRDKLEDSILEMIPDTTVNGTPDRRLPNITNISFRGVEGEALLINLDMQGIAVSTGSACSSGSLEPSPIIRALGADDSSARGAVRFSLGQQTTAEDIDRVMEVLPAAVETLRRMAPAATA